MPHLKYCNRYWRVAGDEFSLPALCSIAGRLSWTALISIILALSFDSLNSCEYGWVLISYLLCSVILFVLSIACDLMIMAVSLRGSVVDTEKRSDLGKYLSIRIILGVLQLLCAVFGIVTLNFRSNVPCNSQFEHSELNRVFVSIVVISQMIDLSAMCCCCYLFSANNVESDGMPRDESWALNTWENRCRRITRSVQVCSCNLFGGANITEGYEEVAKMLTYLFHHDGFLDVVPSDVAAGIVLVRLEQRIKRQAHLNYYKSHPEERLTVQSTGKQSRTETLLSGDDSNTASDDGGNETIESADHKLIAGRNATLASTTQLVGLPRLAAPLESSVCLDRDFTLLDTVTRCCLYALAIYTHLMLVYMKPCTGVCRMLCCAKKGLGASGDSTCLSCLLASGNTDDSVIHGDNACGLHFAGMTTIAEDLKHSEVLFASFSNDTNTKPYAVFLDHEKQMVVITCRGTLSLEDCITDALCEPVELTATGEAWGFDGRDRWAHSGMLSAAVHIRAELEKSNILNKIYNSGKPSSGLKTPLTKDSSFSHYQLMVVGHSLGAATAAILALTLRNAFPKLRCYIFGTPGSVFDRRSALEFSDFITSVVLGNDVVPRLNFFAVCALRNEVLDAISRAKVNKMLIMQAIFRDFDSEDLMHPAGDEPDSDFRRNIVKFKACIKSTLDKIDHHELCLPGRILHLTKTTVEKRCCLSYPSYTLSQVSLDDFAEIELSTTMAADHLPDRYYFELSKLLSLQWKQ